MDTTAAIHCLVRFAVLLLRWLMKRLINQLLAKEEIIEEQHEKWIDRMESFHHFISLSQVFLRWLKLKSKLFICSESETSRVDTRDGERGF